MGDESDEIAEMFAGIQIPATREAPEDQDTSGDGDDTYADTMYERGGNAPFAPQLGADVDDLLHAFDYEDALREISKHPVGERQMLLNIWKRRHRI